MILSCDPPRHAFLIHFGKRQQPQSIQTFESEYHGARVQIALNPESVPPRLVAIHFVRHGFRLPFVGPIDKFSTHLFHLQSGRHHNQYFFHFVCEPRDCQEWQIYPGLTVLVSEPPGFGADSTHTVKDRPILHGLLVDTNALEVDIDMREFVFEFGSDNLKDVSVSLFTERIGS
jgi:hypothetical protein